MKKRPSRRKLLFIEKKTGPDLFATICWGRLSKTGKTVFYKDMELLRIRSYKANHCDQYGDEYWISAPKKNGKNTLDGSRYTVDDDALDAYNKFMEKK